MGNYRNMMPKNSWLSAPDPPLMPFSLELGVFQLRFTNCSFDHANCLKLLPKFQQNRDSDRERKK